MENMDTKIIEVTYQKGIAVITERFNGYPIVNDDGSLAIMFRGLLAAWGAGHWISARVIDPDQVYDAALIDDVGAC